MRRRSILSSVAAFGTCAIAGCIGTLNGSESDTPREVSSPTTNWSGTTTTPRGGKRNVSVEGVDDVPSEARADVSLTLLEDRITAEHPASVRIRFRNAADETRRIGFGVRRPFTTMWSEDEQWLLLQNPDFEPVSRTCWEPPPDVDVGHPLKLVYQEMGPGEEIVGEFELWGNHTDDTCMPAGKTRFTNTYRPFQEPIDEFDWGFELSVKSL